MALQAAIHLDLGSDIPHSLVVFVSSTYQMFQSERSEDPMPDGRVRQMHLVEKGATFTAPAQPGTLQPSLETQPG